MLTIVALFKLKARVRTLRDQYFAHIELPACVYSSELDAAAAAQASDDARRPYINDPSAATDERRRRFDETMARMKERVRAVEQALGA